jgi:hypothetical protein
MEEQGEPFSSNRKTRSCKILIDGGVHCDSGIAWAQVGYFSILASEIRDHTEPSVQVAGDAALKSIGVVAGKIRLTCRKVGESAKQFRPREIILGEASPA